MTQDPVALSGVLGGLVLQQQRAETHALDLDYARRNLSGIGQRYCPPLSCYRTVAQRSLSTPTTFLSELRQVEWGNSFSFTSIFEELLTGSGGAIPPPAGADTIKFLDADRQPDRARTRGMVLIALRAKVSVLWFLGTVINPPPVLRFEAGRMADMLADLIRAYVTISIYHTADDIVTTGLVTSTSSRTVGEPWVDATPLAYFDREGGAFLPVPPLLWPTHNRDPNLQIGVRAADSAPTAADNPQFNNQPVPFWNSAAPAIFPFSLINGKARVSILVEALFVPPPECCEPGQWPGELCPTHKIGLHPDYNPSIPVFERAPTPNNPLPNNPLPASSESDRYERCEECGYVAERILPRPPGLLDPRYNIREALKQMLLLEDHLFHKDKVCADCIEKHCLKVEALGEEGVTLDNDDGPPGRLCTEIADFSRLLEQRILAREDRRKLASDLRLFRKRVAGARRVMIQPE